MSERLARDKRTQLEVAHRGKPLGSLLPDYPPPCYWSSSAFADRPTQVVHVHPFRNLRATHRITDQRPPESVFTWPFRLSMYHSKDANRRDGKDGEDGQYFTPDSISRLMAQMSVDPDARPSAGKPVYIHDPCCGTGRMLLEASKINPHAELVGQDIDARCAKITAINLGLRSRYGWAIYGNRLSGDTRFAYRIGSFFHESPNGLRRGVIREVPVEETPVPVIAGAHAGRNEGAV